MYHDSSEIDAGGEEWIEPTWSSEPAEYDLYYVVSGIGEVQTAHLTELHEQETEGDCLYASVLITDGLVGNSSVTVMDAETQENAACNL